MEGADDRSWLRQPLGPNDVRIHVDVGDGAEISATVRSALDTLVHAVFADEVSGFAQALPKCPSLMRCHDYMCNLGKCGIVTSPCFVNMNCVVQP